jgi:hypothetical protein
MSLRPKPTIRSRAPLLNSTGVFDLRNSDCESTCMALMSLTARSSGLNRSRGILRPRRAQRDRAQCSASPRRRQRPRATQSAAGTRPHDPHLPRATRPQRERCGRHVSAQHRERVARVACVARARRWHADAALHAQLGGRSSPVNRTSTPLARLPVSECWRTKHSGSAQADPGVRTPALGQLAQLRCGTRRPRAPGTGQWLAIDSISRGDRSRPRRAISTGTAAPDRCNRPQRDSGARDGTQERRLLPLRRRTRSSCA